jgi:hypothetical protein
MKSYPDNIYYLFKDKFKFIERYDLNNKDHVQINDKHLDLNYPLEKIDKNLDVESLLKTKATFLPLKAERSKPLRLPIAITEEAFVAGFAAILELHPVYQLRTEANAALQTTGTLLTEASLRKVKEHFKDMPVLKLEKSISLPHSVIISETGVLYAICRGGMIGKGTFGKVKLAQNLSTGEFCVVKTTSDKRVLNESTLLARRALLVDIQSRTNRKNRHKTYLFMRLVPGVRLYDFTELFFILKLSVPVTVQAKLLHSAINELQSLYLNNIYHSDLHDLNILIDPITMTLSIIDYGNAKNIAACASKDLDHFDDIKSLCFYLKQFITDPALREIIQELMNQSTQPFERLDEAKKAVLPHTTSSMKQQLKSR